MVPRGVRRRLRIQPFSSRETSDQGRFGVPDFVSGHAARCHRMPLPAAGRGIYAGWLAADPARVEPGRRAVVRRRRMRHQASRSAASMRVLAMSSPSSRRRRCAAPRLALPAPGSGLEEAPPGAPAPPSLGGRADRLTLRTHCCAAWPSARLAGGLANARSGAVVRGPGV
jgi:hypothetical protein